MASAATHTPQTASADGRAQLHELLRQRRFAEALSAAQAPEMENERTWDSFRAREYGDPRKMICGSIYGPPW